MHYTLENGEDYFCLYPSVYCRLPHYVVDIITETILLVTNLKSKNANHKRAFLSLRTFLKSQHLIYFAKVSKSTELLGQEFLQSCYFLNLV